MLLLVRTLHILAAILLVCGVVGIDVARKAASKSDKLDAIDALIRVMGAFRDYMIRPGGALLVIFGLVTAWYESWPRFSIDAIVLLVLMVPFMVLMAKGSHKLELLRDEAVKAGSITPALRAGFQDRLLKIGSVGVDIFILLFLFLMLVKPS